MKTGYKVCDAMTKKPVTIGPDSNIQECAKIMAEKHIGAIIVKENKKLVGILSEQDIVRKAVIKDLPPSKTIVGDIMEKDLFTISPEKDIFEALSIMGEHNFRHLPVTDDKKNMVGLVTMKDILKIQPQLFDLLVEKFELREEEKKPINKEPGNEGVCQGCGNFDDSLKDVDGTLLCPECAKEQV